jgi:hypothetical protein
MMDILKSIQDGMVRKPDLQEISQKMTEMDLRIMKSIEQLQAEITQLKLEMVTKDIFSVLEDRVAKLEKQVREKKGGCRTYVTRSEAVASPGPGE